MSEKYLLSGTNGKLYVFSDHIEIVRKGLLAKLSHIGIGDTYLDYSNISSVQFRPGTPVINGFIHFYRVGDHSGGGYINSVWDEDSIVFRIFHNDEAREICKYIRSRI